MEHGIRFWFDGNIKELDGTWNMILAILF